MARLGIIAGAGDLPRILAEARPDATPFVVQFAGLEVDWIADYPHMTARFEQPETLFDGLRKAGVHEVVMAGGMSRPKLDPSAFDPTFAAIIPELSAALQYGDDAALKVILRMFETAGFEVRAPSDLLDDLLAQAGVPTLAQPSDYDRADAQRAAEVLAATGPLDIGQGAVVAGGLCLGIETLQGTDALLRFVAETPAELRPERGLLMKAPKPGQERRLDLPSIGQRTMEMLAEARLSGVVLRAGGALMIDRAATIARADALGLFIWVQD